MFKAASVNGVEPRLEKEGTIVMLFMELFEQLGDTIAQQYGGSLAHKKGGGLSFLLVCWHGKLTRVLFWNRQQQQRQHSGCTVERFACATTRIIDIHSEVLQQLVH